MASTKGAWGSSDFLQGRYTSIYVSRTPYLHNISVGISRARARLCVSKYLYVNVRKYV